jgi:teichuronic acid biosynthesis glycosyltransferase TuaC
MHLRLNRQCVRSIKRIMKVLFVASGNSKNFDVSPFIKSQAEVLMGCGVDVQFFSVLGTGVSGYINSAKRLHAFLKDNKFDIIHAHYTLCGWVALLARPKIPVVLSFMGEDVYGTYYKPNKVKLSSRYLTVLTYLIQPFVNAIISKSRNIDNYVYRRRIACIIPNGVKLDQFQNYEKDFREELGLNPKKKYILFLANREDNIKNFKLLQEAFEFIKDGNIEILNPYPVPHEKIVKYLWSADVFVLTSFMEGSPNVLKEAMACNCPIVATDAGDAFWVIENTQGCYAAKYEAKDFSDKLLMALDFAEKNKRTQGRQRLLALELDAVSVAQKIIAVYENVLKLKK